MLKKNFLIAAILHCTVFGKIDFSLLKDRFGRDYPKPFIEKALELFKSRGGKVIVEIGSMRHKVNHDVDDELCPTCADGHSTYLLARTLSKVYSVDISAFYTNVTKESCKNFINTTAITDDGINFLKNFNETIDLLFLDAWDVVSGTDYAEKHLEAYQIAKPKLSEKSLILIDDTDIENGGKGKLLIPAAIKDGYKVIFSGRQTLLSK